MESNKDEHVPCNQIVTLSTTVKIYMTLASSVSLLLVGWATYITLALFDGRTADAVQITKYDIILEKLTVIEKKIDGKLGR